VGVESNHYPETIRERSIAALYGAAWVPVSYVFQRVSLDAGAYMGWTTLEKIHQAFAGCHFTKQVTGSQVFIGAVAGIAFAPIEEFLFRVGVQNILLRDKAVEWFPGLAPFVDTLAGKSARIFLSSLGFALAHFGNGKPLDEAKLQVLNAFGLGLTAGFLQERTKNPYASIGLHMAWNGIAAWISWRKC